MPPVASKSSPATAEPEVKDEVDGAGDSALRALAKQFTLEEHPEAGDSEHDDGTAAEGQPKKGKAKPKNLEQLAEVLGVKVEDLYDLEIPAKAKGAKPFTLGALKDHLAERENFTVSQLKLEEDRSRMESDFMRATTELQTLLAALPETSVKPETLKLIRDRHEATLKKERARVIELIPEWRDEEIRTADLAGIAEHLSGYGFSAGYLKSVYDSRTMKYLRDNFLRKQRLEKALALVGEKKPDALGKGKQQSKQQPNAPTGRATREEQQVQRYLRVLNAPKGD